MEYGYLKHFVDFVFCNRINRLFDEKKKLAKVFKTGL